MNHRFLATTWCLGLLVLLTPLVYGHHNPTWIDAPVPQSKSELKQLQEQLQHALQKSITATVSIVPQLDPPVINADHFESGASGVIISPDGLVLSQAHVTHRTSEASKETGLIELRQPGDMVGVVLHNGQRMKAELLGADYEWDLSMLKIVQPGRYPHLEFSRQKVPLGTWVMKLGHPLGYRPDRGTLVRLGRVLYSGQSTLVTDCQVTGGDSGGPFVDLDGNLAGLAFNSEQPEQLRETVSRELPSLPNLISCLTSAQIIPRIPALSRGEVVNVRNFSELANLRKDHSNAGSFLTIAHSAHGDSMNAAWRELASESNGNVVDILRHERRVAFGTVVGDDGLVVTKASEIGDDPKCRLPDGKIVEAHIVSTDAAYDLAFLHIRSHQIRAVTFSRIAPDARGQLLMAPTCVGSPLAWGIVSAPEARRVVVPTSEITFTPSRTDQDLPMHGFNDGPSSNLRSNDFPIAFEHDIPLRLNQCGGPVIDLSGNVTGITIARAGPHGCIAIPASVIQSLHRTISSQ